MKTWAERILVLAPHADDEVIGCGGLLSANEGSRRHVVVAAVGSFTRVTGHLVHGGDREMELNRALRALEGGRTAISHQFLGTDEGRLDTLAQSALVGLLDRVLQQFQPTSVFLPYPSHHQDHRALYHAALAALRPRPVTLDIEMVAAYEYPFIAFDPAPLSAGKMHFSFDAETLERKAQALSRYASQMQDAPYLDVHRCIDWSRARGREVDAHAAEVFYVLRGRL